MRSKTCRRVALVSAVALLLTLQLIVAADLVADRCVLKVGSLGWAHVSCSYTIESTGPTRTRFGFDVAGVTARSSDGAVSVRTSTSELGAILTLDIKVPGPVTIDFTAPGIVESLPNRMRLELTDLAFVTDGEIIVMLPESAVYIPENSTMPSFLLDQRTGTGLLWNRPPRGLVVEFIPPEEDYSFYIYPLIVFIIMGMAMIYILHRSHEHDNPINVVIRTLSPIERKIVTALKSADGELLQSTLASRLDIPRTSLHRHLKDLESKKVLVLERVGRQNKVRLAHWLEG